jgi:hypothetical protein
MLVGKAILPTPEPTLTAMTVAIVAAQDLDCGAGLLAFRLAELAVNDELLIVCGSDQRSPTAGTRTLITGIRKRLPRYDVVDLFIQPTTWEVLRNAALLDEYMEAGSLPVVLTPVRVASDLAIELFTYLRADRVVRVSCPPDGEVAVHEVRRRRPAAGRRSVCALN